MFIQSTNNNFFCFFWVKGIKINRNHKLEAAANTTTTDKLADQTQQQMEVAAKTPVEDTAAIAEESGKEKIAPTELSESHRKSLSKSEKSEKSESSITSAHKAVTSTAHETSAGRHRLEDSAKDDGKERDEMQQASEYSGNLPQQSESVKVGQKLGVGQHSTTFLTTSSMLPIQGTLQLPEGRKRKQAMSDPLPVEKHRRSETHSFSSNLDFSADAEHSQKRQKMKTPTNLLIKLPEVQTMNIAHTSESPARSVGTTQNLGETPAAATAREHPQRGSKLVNC